MKTKSFHTTCWTQILEARGNSSEAKKALSALCECYYTPVISWLKRAENTTDDEAQEIAHEFFAEILSGDRLEHLDPEKGRFRSYLLGAMKHFLSRRRIRQGAQKRGGGVSQICLDDTPALDPKALPPDQWFDQQWAMALLARALDQIERECLAAGKEQVFRKLSPWLVGEADYGDQAQLAEELGMPPNTLKSTVHRLRKRFRDAVKFEIAATLNETADIEAEMSALFAALRG